MATTGVDPAEAAKMTTLWEELYPLTASFYGRCLDAGCGNGDYSKRLSELIDVEDVVSLDVVLFPEAYGQRFLDNRPREKFVLGSVEALPFADDSFDCVMAWQVVEHTDDPLLALREICRVTKMVAFVALPIRGSKSAWESPEHLHAFTTREFEPLLSKTGFRIEQFYVDRCGCQNWLVTPKRVRRVA